MKKAALLVFLLAVGALAGCVHPNDITDDVAQAAATAARG